MAQATAIVNGWLSSADWTTFNGKQNALGYVPAHSGANSDITSLTGLTTPLSTGQGGSGTAGGTGYRYGNGASPDTYLTTIPWSAITSAGTASPSNVTLGAGAGTGASILSVLGKDTAFIVNFSTGTTPTASSVIFNYVFTNPRTGISYCTFNFSQEGPQIFTSFGQMPYAPPASNTIFSLVSGVTALATTTQYVVIVNCPQN
jgi:hypothetical protein